MIVERSACAAVAAGAALLYAGPAAAQKPAGGVPSGSLDAPSLRFPARDNQTILRIQMNLDVSNFVRPGANTLRVTWKGFRGSGLVRVAHAGGKSAFHGLATVRIRPDEARQAGEKTAAFAQ